MAVKEQGVIITVWGQNWKLSLCGGTKGSGKKGALILSGGCKGALLSSGARGGIITVQENKRSPITE